MAFVADLNCWSGANPQFLEGKQEQTTVIANG